MVAMKHLGYVIEVIGRIIGGPPKRKGDRLKQHQREAIIDALLYCLFADDFDDPAERQIMDRSIARMQWESDLAVNDYVQAASARIKLAVKSRDSEKQLLLDIRDRLETKEPALRSCNCARSSCIRMASFRRRRSGHCLNCPRSSRDKLTYSF